MRSSSKKSQPLPLAEAQKIFDWLATADDLLYNYPEDACYARAWLLGEKLVSRGIPTRAAFLFAQDRNIFQKYRPVKYTNGSLDFSYHAAVEIDVLMPSGKAVPMIIDPTFFNGLVDRTTWAKELGLGPRNIEITPRDKNPKTKCDAYWNYWPVEDRTLRSNELLERCRRSVERSKEEGRYKPPPATAQSPWATGATLPLKHQSRSLQLKN